MKENAIRTQVGELDLSVVLFDEAFPLNLPDHVTERHRHSEYEIFFVLQGAISIEGQGKTVRAQAPAAVILPPLFDHRTIPHELTGYCMYFQWEQKANRQKSRRLNEITEALRDNATAVPLSDEGSFYVRQLAKSAKSDCSDGTEPHLTALLFAEVFRPLFSVGASGASQKIRQYINTIDLYVYQHCREPIRLSNLSKVLYLCPKQISRIIRKKYGCSLSELVKKHRIALAQTLLRETDKSVSEIAAEVGYETPNYFYVQFRQVCNEPPAQYRARVRGEA